MEPAYKKHIIFFENHVHLRTDMSLVETFQDGSQLIHKRSHMIIIKKQNTTLKPYFLKAKISLFSKN